MNNRYLTISADDDLPASEIKKERQPIKLFDTNVWKDSPELQNGVVLTSYIEQLYNEGYTPEQIAEIVNISVKAVKKKLNVIVNSFLGSPSVESRDLRRIEVDDQILIQIEGLKTAMEDYKKKMQEEETPPDIKVLSNYSKQISKLLEVRMKLWGLDAEKTTADPKMTMVGGRTISRVDPDTKSKIADFVIGIVDK